MKKAILIFSIMLVFGVVLTTKKAILVSGVSCPKCGNIEILDMGEKCNNQMCQCFDCGTKFSFEK